MYRGHKGGRDTGSGLKSRWVETSPTTKKRFLNTEVVSRREFVGVSIGDSRLRHIGLTRTSGNFIGRESTDIPY